MNKMMVMTAVAVLVSVANAGPWSAAQKTFARFGGRGVAEEVAVSAEKGAAKSGVRVASGTAGMADKLVRHSSGKGWKIGTKKAVPIAVGTAGTIAIKRESKAAEQIAKVATPGRILAAGVGTAAVVGAHEVSDGVQSTCVSVGKAVEENPEVVRDVVEPVVDSWKQLTLTGLGLVAVLLLWIFYPVLKVARFSAKLWAARHEKRLLNELSKEDPESIQQSKDEGTAIDVGSRQEQGSKLAVVAFLAALSVGYNCAASDAYCDELDVALGCYETQVRQSASNAFESVKAKIPEAVAQYGYVTHLCKIVKSLVCDRLNSGSQTDGLLRQEMQAKFSQDLYDVKALVDRSTAKLVEDLEAIRERYGREFSEPVEVADESEERYYAQIIECAKANAATVCLLEGAQKDADITLLWEAIFFRETVNQIGIYLGKIVARETATAAAAAGAAVCDGPSIFLDVVGGLVFVGMTGWSVYDIYVASKTMPQKIEAKMDLQVGECCREVTRAAIGNGRKIVGVYKLAR